MGRARFGGALWAVVGLLAVRVGRKCPGGLLGRVWGLWRARVLLPGVAPGCRWIVLGVGDSAGWNASGRAGERLSRCEGWPGSARQCIPYEAFWAPSGAQGRAKNPNASTT